MLGCASTLQPWNAVVEGCGMAVGKRCSEAANAAQFIRDAKAPISEEGRTALEF